LDVHKEDVLQMRRHAVDKGVCVCVRVRVRVRVLVCVYTHASSGPQVARVRVDIHTCMHTHMPALAHRVSRPRGTRSVGAGHRFSRR